MSTINQEETVEASFSDTDDSLPAVELPKPKTPTAFVNYNHNSVTVTQDTTTVNNLFRSTDEKTTFLQKIVTELLLSIIEPDRFLKNAKAIAWLALAWVITHLSFEQIKTLVEIYAKK